MLRVLDLRIMSPRERLRDLPATPASL